MIRAWTKREDVLLFLVIVRSVALGVLVFCGVTLLAMLLNYLLGY
jgi:hypothetical protein